MKKELSRIKDLESELDNYKSRYVTVEANLKKATKENSVHRDRDKQTTVILNRESNLIKKENKLEIEMLKHQLKCSNTSNDKIIGFVDALMRNTSFRENKFITHDLRYDSDGNERYIPTNEGTSVDTE